MAKWNSVVPQEHQSLASLDDLALFVAIVEAGSLAGAARSAGLPKSSVSRRLAALEAEMSVDLIRRSTRRLAVTETGQALFDRCRPLVQELRSAPFDMLEADGEAHGRLRVTATGAFGRRFVGPILAEFLELNPRVSADLVLLDRPVDLIDEGFDLAIRMGPLADSGLMRRKLVDLERVLCAAPSYLDRAGPIGSLDELRRHQAVVSVEGNRWAFSIGSKTKQISPNGRFAGNQLETLLDAARSGCGLAVLPLFLIAHDLDRGTLLRLLPDTPPTAGIATLLWPASRNLPVSTRAFIDLLATRVPYLVQSR
jgi:DNA-binding transcriptional LysR family regulator